MRRGVLAIVALCMGCDPGFVLEGSVIDREKHSVGGAQVTFLCYGAEQAKTTTDASGRFSIHKIGAFGNECSVRVDQASAQNTYTLMDHCTKTLRGKCTHVRLDATLP